MKNIKQGGMMQKSLVFIGLAVIISVADFSVPVWANSSLSNLEAREAEHIQPSTVESENSEPEASLSEEIDSISATDLQPFQVESGTFSESELVPQIASETTLEFSTLPQAELSSLGLQGGLLEVPVLEIVELEPSAEITSFLAQQLSQTSLEPSLSEGVQDVPSEVAQLDSDEVQSEIPETFTVREFVFRFVNQEGNEVDGAFSQRTLRRIIRDYLGQITFSQLLEARTAITQFYIDQGYITSGAYIPEQSFSEEDGRIEIQIVEGRLETINICLEGQTPMAPTLSGTELLDEDYIFNLLGMDLSDFSDASSIEENASLVEEACSNEYAEEIRQYVNTTSSPPLNINRLRDALQLLRLNPLVETVRAELSIGSDFGGSQLMVYIEGKENINPSLYSLQGLRVSTDNGRSPSVGSIRTTLEFALPPELSGSGVNNASLAISTTEGSYSTEFSVGSAVPFLSRRTSALFRFGVSQSYVTEEPFNQLDINFPAAYVDLTLQHQFVETPTQVLSGGVTIAHQRSRASILGLDVPLADGADDEGRTRITVLRGFLEWLQRSENHVLAFRVQPSIGLGILATVNEEPPDGRFLSLQAQGQWVRRLPFNTLFVLSADGQFANRPLLTLEQYGLGGADTVRGYRQDFLVTDNGFRASAELRIPVISGSENNLVRLYLIPFADYGIGWNSSRRTDSNPQTLSSAGVGLQFELGDRPQAMQARIDWGIPLRAVENTGDSLQENGIHFSITVAPAVLWNLF